VPFAVIPDLDRHSAAALAPISEAVEHADADAMTPRRSIIAPHITLAAYDSLDAAAMTMVLRHFADGLQAIPVRLSSLGLFPAASSVLFAAPVVSAEIPALHRAYHEAAWSVIASCWAHYLPDRWVLHVTLGEGLTAAVLGKVRRRHRRLAADRRTAECLVPGSIPFSGGRMVDAIAPGGTMRERGEGVARRRWRCRPLRGVGRWRAAGDRCRRHRLPQHGSGRAGAAARSPIAMTDATTIETMPSSPAATGLSEARISEIRALAKERTNWSKRRSRPTHGLPTARPGAPGANGACSTVSTPLATEPAGAGWCCTSRRRPRPTHCRPSCCAGPRSCRSAIG
jgi:2'-5' RNA ligase